MGQILGAIPLRGDLRANATSVLVERVAGAKRGEAAVLAELAGPVLPLLLLDQRAVSVGEGAEISGIHERQA